MANIYMQLGQAKARHSLENDGNQGQGVRVGG